MSVYTRVERHDFQCGFDRYAVGAMVNFQGIFKVAHQYGLRLCGRLDDGEPLYCIALMVQLRR